jgi:hypothetical protein
MSKAGALPIGGWWDYGTGALGDMGCHLIESPFRVLIEISIDVTASVGSVYG